MMTRQERAKQFMPFDALKGLRQALKEREERHSRVSRHEITEEQAIQNSEVISKLERGMQVVVECYDHFHDVTKQGTVTTVNIPYAFLKLNEEKIYFSDIYNIMNC